MKTKLLRKVRKRYSIEYFPYLRGGCIGLKDSVWPDAWRTQYFDVTSECTYDEALAKAHKELHRYIITDYGQYGTRRNKKSQKSIKLWYNEE